MNIEIKELNIQTELGHYLTAYSFSSRKNIGRTMVISSATGVLQKYYSKFASYFAAQGFQVYTFDYFGIGKSGSDSSSLKKNKTTLTSWGANDQAAVVEFAKKQNQKSSITLVTHSIGGQLLGFNPLYGLFDSVVMVASQSGYWKLFKGVHKLKMWFFWYVLIPTLTPLFGYFPSKKLGLFENLPKHMVYEWAKWGKKKEYMLQFYDKTSYFFNKIELPLLSWSFTKDSFAPKNTVDWLTAQFSNANITREHYIPKKGSEHAKHFGFFKPSFEVPLWEKTLRWILNETKK